jgi:hypothetical protein
MSKIDYRYVSYEDDTEHFMCDCCGSDHTVRIYLDTTKYGFTESGNIIDELNIIMLARRGDYETRGWWKRLMWRLKMAYRIIIDGELEYEAVYTPCRRFGEYMVGVKEMRRFTEHINKQLDKIEDHKNNFYPEYTRALREEFTKHLVNEFGSDEDKKNI